MDFPSPASTTNSTLAKMLLCIEEVQSVFYGPESITVTKKDDHVEWKSLKPEIYVIIMGVFASGLPVLTERKETDGEETHDLRKPMGKLSRCICSEAKLNAYYAEWRAEMDSASHEAYVIRTAIVRFQSLLVPSDVVAKIFDISKEEVEEIWAENEDEVPGQEK